METTITQASQEKKGIFKNFTEAIQFSYFGVISFTITVGSCLGGITAMYLFQNKAPVWMIALSIVAAMANNVAAIAQVPAKWLIRVFFTCFAVLISLLAGSFLL
ncbi:MAG: hypothetical protein N3F09_03935 [Bacteroidia bacterium]|nr:hypothetical protein [Bacteroidia bacterium]